MRRAGTPGAAVGAGSPSFPTHPAAPLPGFSTGSWHPWPGAESTRPAVRRRAGRRGRRGDGCRHLRGHAARPTEAAGAVRAQRRARRGAGRRARADPQRVVRVRAPARRDDGLVVDASARHPRAAAAAGRVPPRPGLGPRGRAQQSDRAAPVPGSGGRPRRPAVRDRHRRRRARLLAPAPVRRRRGGDGGRRAAPPAAPARRHDRADRAAGLVDGRVRRPPPRHGSRPGAGRGRGRRQPGCVARHRGRAARRVRGRGGVRAVLRDGRTGPAGRDPGPRRRRHR